MLGEGACGQTVHIRDDAMACDFVVKKYIPKISNAISPELHDDLLGRFREEARILFQLNHPNVVRVFNYFDYPEFQTGYILMEYIDGSHILDFLSKNPALSDKVFEKVIDGFVHLEAKGILHRDIRPMNIMVVENGIPKIIDFGFGKNLNFENHDQKKSISLNWWCEIPPEFDEIIYDFQTEVYFVGKLFEKAIADCTLSEFKYLSIVRKMCEGDRDVRFCTFADVQRSIVEGKFSELKFSEREIQTYRYFVDGLVKLFSSIGADARYERDTNKIIDQLEVLHSSTMLDDFIAVPVKLARVFVSGPFSYFKNQSFRVTTLRYFLDMLKGLSAEKKNIVLDNLLTRLDAVERVVPDLDDDIPF